MCQIYTNVLYVFPNFTASNFASIQYTPLGEFSYVSGRINLARRLGYFLINKYIPCILIICMSFVTFWIPAEAYPARVTLSVTSLLTIVTQQYQSSMPSVSYVVALNIWMLSCIGFVFFSLLEYAFVIAVMNNKGTSLWPFRKLKVSTEICIMPMKVHLTITDSICKLCKMRTCIYILQGGRINGEYFFLS